MKIEVLTPEKENAYGRYLLKHEHSSFNSSLRFRDFFLGLSPKSIAYYFLAMEDDEIVGVLPSFMIKGPVGPVLNSMPWFGSNPGVLADNDEATTLLLQAFQSTANWTNCFSSTLVDSPYQSKQCLEMHEAFFWRTEGFASKRTAMVTELPRFGSNEQFAADLMKKFHRKIQDKIIKATSRCMIYEVSSKEDFDFARNLHINNAASGARCKDREFGIIRSILKSGAEYKLYVAFADDRYATKIAFLLVWYFNRTADCLIVEVDPKYKHLHPLPLLVFSAMGDVAQRGCRWWNWGRTEPTTNENDYLKRKRFGADPCRYSHYTRMYESLPAGVASKYLSDNYPYYFVIPYGLLGG